jgi:hypothetical protein
MNSHTSVALLDKRRRQFSRPNMPEFMKTALVDALFKAMLIKLYITGQLKVGQLRENKALLAAANEYLRERHPELADKAYVLDSLVGIPTKDIEAVIDETIIETLAREEGVSVRALVSSDLVEAAMTYLAERHPHLEIEKGFDVALLEGKWAKEVEAVLNEVSQQENETNISPAS